MNHSHLFKVFVLLLLVSSCEIINNPRPISIEELNGYIQKGPFLNGTTIIVSELSEDLFLTGKTYTSQILDNTGTFTLTNIELASSYVELKADGFYFDEVRNENSTSQLTLYALGDISNKTSMNVNILSHLERNRVNYLLSEGESFEKAKEQAMSEILAIFEMDGNEIGNSETLDISKDGNENAMLLAISVIMQGKLSISDFSELIANINTDIRQDGVLNSETLGETLINNAHLLDPVSIRANLEDRYDLLGLDVSIPDFEDYLEHFISNTPFIHTNEITYPESGIFGENLLAGEKSVFQGGVYSISAFLPELTNLKVKLLGSGCYLNHNPYDVTNIGWDVESQPGHFTSTQTGQIDLFLTLEKTPPEYDEDSTLIETTTKFELQVFENEDQNATWIKNFEVK